MITRTLGKFLRGKATASQILTAALLGGVIGFVPAALSPTQFWQAPGLALALFFSVLVLNANLAVFAITLVLAKIVSGFALPVSFAVGQFLLDGPFSSLFALLINAPVFAWFGLEHYTTTGAIPLGLAFGGLVGFLFWKSLCMFRSRMAGMEHGSERYQQLTQKRWNKFLVWIFFGKGHGNKMTYGDLMRRNEKRLPIRFAGVGLVAVFVASLWLLQGLLGGSMFRNALQGGLERWNTATVDLASASLDLPQGQLTLEGLAVADPQHLDHDLFRARLLNLKFSTKELLSRRLVIDDLTSAEASSGDKRKVPGRLIPLPKPEPRPKQAKPPAMQVGDTVKQLDQYLKEAKAWKERLVQMSAWLGYLAGSAPSEGEERQGAKGTGEADVEAAAEAAADAEARQRRRAAHQALTRITAHHLITEFPTVLVRNLTLQGVKSSRLPGDLLDIRAKNLASHPWLVVVPLELSIQARSGKFAFHVTRIDGKVHTSIRYKGIPVDDVMTRIAWQGEPPLAGGTMDLELIGELDCNHRDGVRLDLPLNVVLHDTTLKIQGLRETKVKKLAFPLRLHGPLAAPSVTFRHQAFTNALIEAGQRQLADELQARTGQLIKKHAPKVEKLAGDAEKRAMSEADKARQQATAKAEAARKAAKAKAEQEKKALQKKAEDSLKGLVPKSIWPPKPKK